MTTMASSNHGDKVPHEPDLSYRMFEMMWGGWISQIIRAAASLSLADHLYRGPMTATAIAQAEGLDESATFRLLRACVSLGLAGFQPDGSFRTTPLLDTLRKDHPASQRAMAIALAAPGHWNPWGRIVDVLRTGRSQTVEALGSDVFAYFARTPDEESVFTEAMASLTALEAREVTRVLDLSGVGQVCDIGGAGGALLFALLADHPAVKGLIFDRPTVAEIARGKVAAHGLTDRVDVVQGDFFEDVPESDLYLLKHILHDWNDAECVQILKSCRRRLRLGGRIAIIELVLGEVGETGFAPLQDINMLVVASGRERTFAEYQTLLEAAGFGEARMIRTGGPVAIVEARGA